VTNAYSKGGIPLTVQGVANVKIAGHEPASATPSSACSASPARTSSRSPRTSSRATCAACSAGSRPEEVNEDKLAFAEKLLEEAEHDLAKLGLMLDTMKIQNVHDERGYLDSIGRKQSAEIIKKARIAEANAKAARSARRRQPPARPPRRGRRRAADRPRQAERRIGDAQSRRAGDGRRRGQVNAAIARPRPP
jgi:flotillin